jgi:hypothetical protein
MSAALSRRLDDEGLPLPPPVHGRVSGVLLRVLVYGKKAMFIAIALTLLVIAVVVFVRGSLELVLAPSARSCP